MLSDKVKQHFNTAAQAEWERLDINEYYRLIFRLHLDFIKEELAAKPRVLDAGSGPGRYALEFAKRGCAVTLCDIWRAFACRTEIRRKRYRRRALCSNGFT